MPWGIPTGSNWYQNLNLERDIDALWMGKRRTKKRGKQLVNIQGALQKLGLNVYWADGVSQPFVYGEERTRLLNRAKITLNLGPTWYDPGFQFRFVLAAATIP